MAIYKTVLIIFPLNLQTITITLDVVNGAEGQGAAVVKCLEPAPNTELQKLQTGILTRNASAHCSTHTVSATSSGPKIWLQRKVDNNNGNLVVKLNKL